MALPRATINCPISNRILLFQDTAARQGLLQRAALLSAPQSHACHASRYSTVPCPFELAPGMPRRHDMQLLGASRLASQLALLLLLLPLNTVCAATHSSHDVDIHNSSQIIPHDDNPTLPPLPSVQPFSTEPVTNHSSLDITTPAQPLYIFRILDFQAILTLPIIEFDIAKALERAYEVIAFSLLDLDHLEAQNLILRFGDLSIDFHDIVEQLSILAIKKVVMKLFQMVMKGMLGFVEGEIVDVLAGVRMAFAFGLVDGH